MEAVFFHFIQAGIAMEDRRDTQRAAILDHRSRDADHDGVDRRARIAPLGACPGCAGLLTHIGVVGEKTTYKVCAVCQYTSGEHELFDEPDFWRQLRGDVLAAAALDRWHRDAN